MFHTFTLLSLHLHCIVVCQICFWFRDSRCVHLLSVGSLDRQKGRHPEASFLLCARDAASLERPVVMHTLASDLRKVCLCYRRFRTLVVVAAAACTVECCKKRFCRARSCSDEFSNKWQVGVEEPRSITCGDQNAASLPCQQDAWGRTWVRTS